MNIIQKKSVKSPENSASFTNVLRMLCKQKECIANNFKAENEQLHKLLLKQQNLLNKLNEDNMTLNRNNSELKSRSDLNKSTMKHSIKQTKEELIEQNKSLKEQLLVSQNYGARLLSDLNDTKQQLKMALKREGPQKKVKTENKYKTNSLNK